MCYIIVFEMKMVYIFKDNGIILVAENIFIRIDGRNDLCDV